jgi:hypothetical protein
MRAPAVGNQRQTVLAAAQTSPEGKGCEADHAPPYTTEVKNDLYSSSCCAFY